MSGVKRPVFKLVAGIAALSSVWLVVLPLCAQIAPIRAHIERMEAEGIEVDAMFYTELNWEPPSFHARPASSRSDSTIDSDKETH